MYISYICNFYHVFPLHLNTFNLLFWDVIGPKVERLRTCVNDLFCLSSRIYNLDPQQKIKFIYIYYINHLFLNSTRSFKSFIYNIDTGKLFEPYVKILIDALDHDIEVLTNLISYLNIFDMYCRIMKLNIEEFFSHSIKRIEEEFNVYLTPFREAPFKSYLKPFISYIKNKINIFLDYFSVHQHVYSLKGKISQIRNIQRLALEPLKKCLKEMDSSNTLYILIIESILKKYNNTDRYALYNIQELSSIKSAQNDLTILRENIRDIKNDIQVFKKELDFRYRLIAFFIKLKPRNQDGFNKFFEQPKTERMFILKIGRIQVYLSKLSTFKKKSINLTNQIIGHLDILLGYIPNLRQKLSKAESKLDKRKYIEHLLKLLEFENIDSLNEIHTIIDNIGDRSQINLIDHATVNSMIIGLIFHTQSRINEVHVITFIEDLIKKSFRIINNFISIKCIINSKISVKLDINNLKVSIKKLKSAINQIQPLNEIDFNMMEEIEKKINLMEQIKKLFDLYKNVREFKELKTQNLSKIINDIILILNLMKSLSEGVKRLKEQLVTQLKCCEHKIKDLECSIEGVPGNMILCSVEERSNDITKCNNSNQGLTKIMLNNTQISKY